MSDKIVVKEKKNPYDYHTQGSLEVFMDYEEILQWNDKDSQVYQFIDEVLYSKFGGSNFQDFLDNNKINIVFKNFRKFVAEKDCKIFLNDNKIVFLTKGMVRFLHHLYYNEGKTFEELQLKYGINVEDVVNDNHLPRR